jgi:hypothetical protein
MMMYRFFVVDFMMLAKFRRKSRTEIGSVEGITSKLRLTRARIKKRLTFVKQLSDNLCTVRTSEKKKLTLQPALI